MAKGKGKKPLRTSYTYPHVVVLRYFWPFEIVYLKTAKRPAEEAVFARCELTEGVRVTDVLFMCAKERERERECV